MIIKGNVVYVFDVEVFPNVFSCTIKNTNNKQITVFEISPRKNDVKELVAFFMQPKRLFCGYNNIHYDNQLINYLIENKPVMHTADMITLELKKLSDQIIESEQGKSKYKYNTKYPYIDLLTMLFSSKLRVGLKEMQVTMRYHNVQEYEGSFNKQLPLDKIDEMLAYNINDVESTEELLYRKIEDIKLRLGIEKEFGVECLSKDGMTIGNEILKIKYLEASGKKWDEIKNLRNYKEEVALKDIILPFIKFDTPSLQAMLEEMKTLTVSPGRKGYEKHILVGGLEHVVSVGGLHSANTPEIIIPNDDEVLLDSDVNSMYPSTIIAHKCYPRHLGEIWLKSYEKILNDRLEAKHSGNTLKNSTLKLALNGASGNMQNEYNWMCDTEAILKVRINDQLMMLMLIEKIIAAGGKIKQSNTDGALYLFPKAKLSVLDKIIKDWEKVTKLTMETEEFEAFYQYAINDYLGVLKGYKETKNPKLLKKKGLFIDEVTLGKGMQPMIIPKAINEYFANGISVEDTVNQCDNIHEFITYQKVAKKFCVEYKNELISHINRYYVSKAGAYLYKCIIDMYGKRGNYANMLKGHGVTIVNKLTDTTVPQDVDRQYYIAEAKKIIDKFEHQQLSLFGDEW